jgi:hypothetical protein
MRGPFICCIIMLILFFEKVPAQTKDTLFFINKSIIIGELKKIRLGEIEFDADGMGIVRIKYDKLKTMNAASHKYRVETTDKQLFYGLILPAENAGSIIIKTDNAYREIKIATISSLSFLGQSLSTRLNGNTGAGYSFTKSSNIGRLNFNGAVNYTVEKFEASLDAASIVTTDSSSTFRERENLKFSTNYLLGHNWFAVVLLSYQRNKELGLKSRWQQGIGAGYKFLKKQNSFGNAVSGVVINTESSFTNVKNTLFEYVLQAGYHLYSFSRPNINFATTQTIFVSLSQKGRFRADGDIRINWELINDLAISLSFYHNYDRRSPATNAPGADYGFVTGLSYTF